jgi:uncharacterized protein (DUF1015 family)
MARIFPFRALRYDPRRVPVESVVTQPYDKITPAMQDRYYAANPYNLVRIILGKKEAGDDEIHDIYSRAADHLRAWRREGVLRQDDSPSLYAYSQEFRLNGQKHIRRGFIGLGQIEPYEASVVFRHEQTLSGPKQDRLRLLRSTAAHFGQLFMLYSDPQREAESHLFPDSPPTVEVTDEYGVVHRLWQVSDPARVSAAQRAMADKKLVIADGHHRYETALAYRDERRAQGAMADGQQPYDRVMMTFVNMDSPGLVILPTHRVVHGLSGFQAGEMVRVARTFFAVEDITSHFDAEHPTAALEGAGEGTALLAISKGNKFLLRASSEATHPSLAGLSPMQAELDVVRLHKVLLESVLGLSEQSIREQKNLEYVRDAREAVSRVEAGADVAFLIRPVRVEQVRDIAFAGQVMPQKSTDFYPKLLSGLTIYALD